MISRRCEIVCSDGRCYSWYRFECPTDEEIYHLERFYNLSSALIQEVLDPNELSRSEFILEIPARLVIMRIPFLIRDRHDQAGLWLTPSRITVALCFFILDGVLISVSNKELTLFFGREFFRPPSIDVKSVSCFVLQILLYSASEYLQYLKALNTVISEIESQLEVAVDNSKVITLFKIEKSLHHFQTSLRSNEILLEKLPKLYYSDHPGWTWGPDEKELLQDVSIEVKEAVEITQMYLKILHSMATAFSSVADNNLNIAMKRLTLISVVLMLPTLLASFFGMNVLLPFSSMQNQIPFWIVAGLSVGVSTTMWLILKLGRFL